MHGSQVPTPTEGAGDGGGTTLCEELDEQLEEMRAEFPRCCTCALRALVLKKLVRRLP